MTEKKRIAINKEVFDLPLSTHLVRSTQIRIAIVLIMCGGFGDIIAGTKLLLYLRRWYPRAAVRVVTTTPRIFEKMGVPRAHLAPVRNRRDANQQCLLQTYDETRLNRTQLGPPANFRRPDLILPFLDSEAAEKGVWSAREASPWSTVRQVFPHSTPRNTYFISEYNAPPSRAIALPLGIGPRRCGLLFTDAQSPAPAPPRALRGGAYLVAYLGGRMRKDSKISRAPACLGRFLRAALRRCGRRASPVLDVVIPPGIGEELHQYPGALLRRVPQRYDIMLDTRARPRRHLRARGRGRALRLRADILPLPHRQMEGLFRGALPDVLVTGDQSLTDVLGWCHDEGKRIWYQRAPWKTALGDALARELRQPALRGASTSCGHGPVPRPGRYTRLVRNNDFRVKGRRRLDRMVAAAGERRQKK